MIHECCMKGFHKLVLQGLSTNMLYKSVRQPCCTKGFQKLVLKLWSYINKNIERDLFFYNKHHHYRSSNSVAIAFRY